MQDHFLDFVALLGVDLNPKVLIFVVLHEKKMNLVSDDPIFSWRTYRLLVGNEVLEHDGSHLADGGRIVSLSELIDQ